MNDVKIEAKSPAAADWKFRQTAGQFARSGYAISGALDQTLLTRCGDGDIDVLEARGGVKGLATGSRDRAGFTVDVAGRLGLMCQSCAKRYEMPVDSHSTIFVARDAAELAGWEDESFESIEANEKTSALELVEDELLLAVPYVPRCLDCEAVAIGGAPRVFEFN
jgi:uncharacterized metal-binding protein YceD (DUF177 family)